MKKYKVIVSDYDGTLVNDNKEITPKTLKAINDFVSRGGIFIVCTGRMTTGIDHYLKDYNLNCLLASYNGGELINLVNGEVLYSHPIDTNTCYKVFKLFEELGIMGHCYDKGTFVSKRGDKRIDFYQKMQGTEPIIVDKISDYIKENGVTSVKLLAFDDKEILDKHYKTVKESFPSLEVIRSNDEQIDINIKGVTKGNAIKLIAERLNIGVEDILAVGDAGNDIPMLKVAGFSVAMGNASEEIKNICDAVTLDNNSDGIAHLIEKYCI
ncbi:MAG: HAD family phosphatase [Clostridia bacterium]|nr:HAD family phosphatase [Clostridia bacterium]